MTSNVLSIVIENTKIDVNTLNAMRLIDKDSNSILKSKLKQNHNQIQKMQKFYINECKSIIKWIYTTNKHIDRFKLCIDEVTKFTLNFFEHFRTFDYNLIEIYAPIFDKIWSLLISRNSELIKMQNLIILLDKM
jgi:hypothetical protein